MFSFGKDGILYKCDIEREWQKYRTVSSAMDQKNSSLMIDKLTTMRGHIDNASLSKKKGIVLKSPPRFGISSKSMKIEKVRINFSNFYYFPIDIYDNAYRGVGIKH